MRKFFYILLFIFITQILSASNYKDLYKQALKTKNKTEALILLNKSFKLATEAEDTLFLLKIYDQYVKFFEQKPMAQMRFLRKKVFLAEKYYENHFSAKLLREIINDDIKLGELASESGDFNLARDYFLKALDKASILKDDKLINKAYFSLANLNRIWENYNKAIEYYEQSLNYAYRANDTIQIFRNHLFLGLIYLEKNQIEKAYTEFLEAKAFISDYNNPEILKLKIQLNCSIAQLYLSLNLLDSALYYGKKSISVSEQLNDTTYLIGANLILGQIYLRKNEVIKAINYFLEANSYIRSQTSILAVKTYLFLAKAYLKNNHLQEAEKFLKKAQQVLDKIDSKKYKIWLLYLWGDFYMKLHKFKIAEQYLLEAFEQATELYDKELKAEIAETLSIFYTAIEDYEKALKYYKIYKISTDSLRKSKYFQDLLKAHYQTLIKSQKLKIKYLEKLKRDFINKLILLIGLLAISLIISLIALLESRKKNKILEQQKEQIRKQQEIIEKQNEHYKTLSLVASHTRNSIFILDRDGNILWVNDAFEHLYDMTFEEFLEKKGRNFRTATTYPYPDKIFYSCLIERKPFIYHNKHIINGKTIWIQTTISPVIENGAVTKLIGIESDITRIKEAEEKVKQHRKELEEKNKLLEFYNRELKATQEALLKQNEELRQQQEELRLQTEILKKLNSELERLSIVAKYTDNSVFIFNPNGDLEWVNEAFTRNTGYTFEEFIEKFGRNITTASSYGKIAEYFSRAIEEKVSVKYISKFITKYGRVLWLQTILTPILDNDKEEVKKLVAIDSDVTDIKMAEQKILEQNKEIISSLEYASRIQRSILPLPVFISAIFEEYFILNKPKNIVSGDFYFVNYKNGKAIVALADCTGHGIPGAFMSILGSMSFNIVLNRIKEYKPDKILSELKIVMMRMLHQRGRAGDAFDSMDVALCVFDLDKKTLEYSGANLPIYLVRKEEDETEPEVRRIKPTKTTIGYDFVERPFIVHTIKLSVGDHIYMTSDGYLDQFGGPQNKKFKRKRFFELLKKVYGIRMAEQKIIFEKTIEEWRGENEQVDDILVFGIKIT